LVDSDLSAGWWSDLWRLLTIADKVLIVTSLAACAAAYDSPWTEAGEAFAVSVEGSVHGPYRLGLAREYEFEGPLGITRIVAEGGAVRITSSPCANGICMRSGSIRRVGQAIACVPNRIVAEVRGDSQPERFDAVAR
jgi:hypothetical protein